MSYVFHPGDDVRKIRHFHFFCGLGAGAKGFNRGEARVGKMVAEFECLGGIDIVPDAIKDFEDATGVKGTVLDLFDEAQYLAWHGRPPPAGWRQAGAAEVRQAAGNQRPHVVFLSAPCKGLSGLLAKSLSKTAKYQALNGLTVRGVWLMLEAWKDDPVELIVFENVPLIAKRGRHLLDQIIALLRAYGYATAETAHDCGELGGLAQTRKRFLMVARHAAKVPNFLYEPVKRPLRAVGEVLDQLPLPGDIDAGGPMHRIPNLQWKTWVRLAFVEAGGDWRSLNKLEVKDGYLRDFCIVPETPLRNGALGVNEWGSASGTVQGESLPSNGRFAVADPREADARYGGYLGVNKFEEPAGAVSSRGGATNGAYSVADPRYEGLSYGQYGVRPWNRHTGAVIGVKSPGQGGFAVADPRDGRTGERFSNVYRIVRTDRPSPVVSGGASPSAGGLGVADPRSTGPHAGAGKYRVTRPVEASGTVIGASTTGQGAFALADPRMGNGPNAHTSKMAVIDYDSPSRTVAGSDRVGSGALSVADPRPEYLRDGRESYLTAGMYGVNGWGDTAGAVAAAGQHDNGRWSVADPRLSEIEPQFQLPSANDNMVAYIRSLDGTWHRPFTTLELAALQGMVDPGEMLVLNGMSDSAWRERIGNAVPPPAAQAIASVMGKTLLLAWSGQTFQLSSEPIWVQPIAVGLSVASTFDIEAAA